MSHAALRSAPEALVTAEPRASGAPPPDARLGKIIKGTYRVCRLIASGGMGAVYEAEHVRLHRPVAVKVLLDATHPALARHLRMEAELIGRLGHPNVVQVLDVDEDEQGDPFFVMEYLDGETASERLRRLGPFPVLEAIRVISQAAAALAQVHAAGVVHCDLKPTNIFLVHVRSQPDFVKLLDFGVSVDMERPEGAKQRGSVVGTPSYMAPEQARGAPFDAKVDQFALAAIAYELLSGRRAFRGEGGKDVLDEILAHDPPPLSQAAPWVPSVFDGVLARALSKSPKERYPSIYAFASALEHAANDDGMDRETHSHREPRPGRYSLHAGEQADVVPLPSKRTLRTSEPPTSLESRAFPRAARASTIPPPSAPPAFGPELLLEDARSHYLAGRLDDAVAAAERLLELAVYEKRPGALRTMAAAIPALDAIFEARVGDASSHIEPGPALPELRCSLSPRASQLVARVHGPMTVALLLERSAMPRRDCIRLIAGLLHRRALVHC